MLAWLSDYLLDRAAKVRCQGATSSTLTFERGTPQGSILSPTLFNLLMERIVDLPFDTSVYAVSYADDVALFAADGHGETWQAHIQEALDRMDNACTYWGLKISPPKSRIMPMRHSSHKVPVHIQGQVIKEADTFKYLGFFLDRQMKCVAHLKYLQPRIAQRLNMARYISSRKCGAGPKVIRAFYVGAIRSLLEYGAPAMITANKSVIARLEVLQNRALRAIAKAPIWTNKDVLRRELRLPPLHARRKRLLLVAVDKYLRREQHPCNIRLRSIREHPTFDKSLGSWTYRTLLAMEEADLSWPEYNHTVPRAPWKTCPAAFIIELPEGGKECHPPTALAATAELTILELQGTPREDTLVIYTDGSVDPDKGTAGSGFVGYVGDKIVGCSSVRIPGGSSTLQAELHAILRALEAAEAYELPSLLVCTDSLGSLQTLQLATPGDNHLLVETVHELLDRRETKGQETIFYWVPSHVGVRGNEAADKAAKEALTLDQVQPIPLSRGNQRSKIYKMPLDPLPDQPGTSLATYLRRVDGTTQMLPPLATRGQLTDLLYLRLGYKLYREAPFPKATPSQPYCPDCLEDYSICHHFLECTLHTPATSALLDDLAIGNMDMEDTMTQLVRRSAANPTPVLQFLDRWPVPFFEDPHDVRQTPPSPEPPAS